MSIRTPTHLTRIELAHATFGLVSDAHGTILQAAPIAAWSSGRPINEVIHYYENSRHGIVTDMGEHVMATRKQATVEDIAAVEDIATSAMEETVSGDRHEVQHSEATPPRIYRTTNFRPDPKGDLKAFMIRLGAKDYLQVAGRVLWLEETILSYSIETQMLHIDLTKGQEVAVFKATVTILDDQQNVIKRCSSTGSETYQDFKQGWVEKAETKAIGRALALAGFGTQFAGADFDEGERIVDSPINTQTFVTKATQAIAETNNPLSNDHATKLRDAILAAPSKAALVALTQHIANAKAQKTISDADVEALRALYSTKDATLS